MDKGLETRISKSKRSSRSPDKPSLLQEICCIGGHWCVQDIDGFCKLLQSVSIGSPVRLPSAKCRLSEIIDEEIVNDETRNETERTPPPVKKSRVMWHSDSE